MKRFAIASGTAVGLLSCFVLAHEDDPKWQHREAPFNGPIWRANGVTNGLAGDGGVAGADFDSSGVALLSWFPLNTLSSGANSGNDCWGYVTPQGKEIAIIGLSNGTAFVDVTDPINAFQIGFISGPTSLWRDIKVFGTHAYAVSEGGQGIQVINLANADQGQVSLTGTVTSGGGQSTHNVALNTQSGYLYRCGGGSNVGLRMYNLNQSATNPPFAGEWSDRYVHDAQVVNYTSGPYAGKEVAFCCAGFNNGSGSTGLYIVDVTNKAAPVLMGSVLYPHAAYSHQGWLSEDRKWFYLGDELDEGDTVAYSTVVVIDVSDLTDPRYLVGRHNGNTAITHNFYTHLGKLFCANYRSGLRVFDILGNGSQLSEIAYLDTYPGSDAAAFNGLWGVYPYFPSGTVIGSDLERGLFVMRVGPDPIQFSFPVAVPDLLNPEGQSIDVDLILVPGHAIVPGSAVVTVAYKDVTEDVALVPVSGTRYRADLPAIACGLAGSIQFIAQDTTGEWMRWPRNESHPVTWAESIDSILEDSLESGALGWVAGYAGDTAVSGKWTLVDPVGTGAQPEDDHSPTGTKCFVTGQGLPGGADGANDIDTGFTTLVSPAFNAVTIPDPVISFWYWLSSDTGANPNSDPFRVDLSFDNGTIWTTAFETTQSTGGWQQCNIRIRDTGPPSLAMRARFVASDVGLPSTVEAAVDDFRIDGLTCPGALVPGDLDGDGVVGGTDLSIVLGSWGSSDPAADVDASGVVDGADLAILMVNWD
ncbi:MAG: choice-of-anchor B family protein [Planctomycetota bacterium]|nr:choice-of-anchor B family protein [Planctomycetota bacterium]MDA1105727.1 choice-of-anchor B family protein [Planctomycetota bacterium]